MQRIPDASSPQERRLLMKEHWETMQKQMDQMQLMMEQMLKRQQQLDGQ